MSQRSLRLPRIAGIDVQLDASLLVFAALFAWVFGAGFVERHPLPTAAVMALVGTLLFLASTLAHEIAHGLEARYRDIEVHGITLFFFGGMTRMRTSSRRPRDELAVSAVGPFASLVCGAVFGLLYATAPALGPVLRGPVSGVAGLLAGLNVALAVFNLVPAAPLDGGRMLRAGLWWLLGDRERAVRITARAGQLLAAALGLLGVWLAVRLEGARLFGAVLVMVGVFLWQAARAELHQADVDRLLRTATVADLLDQSPPPLPADHPLDIAEADPAGRPAPVIADGHVVGLLPAERLAGLHPTDRSARSAGELMDPLVDPPVVGPDAPLRDVVDRLLAGVDAVAVTADAGPVAVLREADVARGLRRLRGGRRRRRSAPRREART